MSDVPESVKSYGTTKVNFVRLGRLAQTATTDSRMPPSVSWRQGWNFVLKALYVSIGVHLVPFDPGIRRAGFEFRHVHRQLVGATGRPILPTCAVVPSNLPQVDPRNPTPDSRHATFGWSFVITVNTLVWNSDRAD